MMNNLEKSDFKREFVDPFLKGGEYEILGRAIMKKWREPIKITVEDCEEQRSRQGDWPLLPPDIYFNQAKHQLKISVDLGDGESFSNVFIEKNFDTIDLALLFARTITDAVRKAYHE